MWFPTFVHRYFRIDESDSLKLLQVVVDQFYLRVSEGETDLMLNPRKTIENIATKEIVRYFRNEIPEMHL